MFKRNVSFLIALLCAVFLVSTRVAHAQDPDSYAKPSAFTFSLDKPSLTSAGIYTKTGRLVRVLWTQRQLPAGKTTETWDGDDDRGVTAPPGEEYVYRVVVNRTTYRCVGSIGNSGQPPNAAGHVPVFMSAVAVDGAGAVYTANAWDESGADFKKWDARGKPVYDAHYQIRNGTPNGLPYAIATDDRYFYCAVTTQERKWQQIWRFRQSDGGAEPFTAPDCPSGHIAIVDDATPPLSASPTDSDLGLLQNPVRGVAVSGSDLLVTDARSGLLRRFDRATGAAKGSVAVPLPQAVAVSPVDGRVFVGFTHHRVGIVAAEGGPPTVVLDNIGDVTSLAFGPDGALYVADGSPVANPIRVYTITGNRATLRRTFGGPGEPGGDAPDRFFHLVGIAVDREGNLVTLQQEPFVGARLTKWGKLPPAVSETTAPLWEQRAGEFVSTGNFGDANPSGFFSTTLHRYTLTDREMGTWRFAGASVAEEPGGVRYSDSPSGVPRVLRWNGTDFFYVPTGDGVQIYRRQGATLRLASVIGASDPSSTGANGSQEHGLWTWTDTGSSGVVKPEAVHWFRRPGQDNSQVFGREIDTDGTIWYAERPTATIWKLPMTGLTVGGNPIYDWSQAQVVIPRDESPFAFEPTMVQHAVDGATYALGWSHPYPSPPNNPLWMGGTTLTKFASDGRMAWAVELPEVAVGLDTLPTKDGGCIVGGGKSVTLYHYASDGLLVGSVKPGPAMGGDHGWFDTAAALAVHQAPHDKAVDVFTEDAFVGRIGWFRITAGGLKVLEGKITVPKAGN